MSGRFHNITKEEMDQFIKEIGFQAMSLPKTSELVYGKIFNYGGQTFSLRIYSAINPSGNSREIGTDAIRVQLYWMYNGEPTLVGKPQTCLRVKNWKANIKNAIDRVFDKEHFAFCPKCRKPMSFRKKQKFFGCVSFFNEGCKGSVAA